MPQTEENCLGAPVNGSEMAVLLPPGGRFTAECGRHTLKRPWFQLWVLLLSITSAGTVGTHAGEGRGVANVLPRSLPPAPPPSLPSLAHPRLCRFGPFVCASSREEVPSHLTLRKWFQCTLV